MVRGGENDGWKEEGKKSVQFLVSWMVIKRCRRRGVTMLVSVPAIDLLSRQLVQLVGRGQTFCKYNYIYWLLAGCIQWLAFNAHISLHCLLDTPLLAATFFSSSSSSAYHLLVRGLLKLVTCINFHIHISLHIIISFGTYNKQ